MIDIHNHLLPGLDDGARNIETTLGILDSARNQGINKIIATPHYFRGMYENAYEAVVSKVSDLNLKIKEEGLNIEVFPGQEILLDKYTLDLLKEGIIHGLNDSDYMLVEFRLNAVPKDALDMIYEIKIQGITPIIAHPERYIEFIKKPERINDFLEEGCIFQINSGSIIGSFGKEVKKTAKLFLEHGLCDFIASDAHSVNSRGVKNSEALEVVKKLDKHMADRVLANAEAIFENGNITCKGEKITKRRFLF